MAQTSDILAAFQLLQALHEDVHWFCPRVGQEDDGYYYPEDVEANFPSQDLASDAERILKVEAATTRITTIFQAIQIFAFDGKDAANYQDWLETHLGKQMTRCDICVREFHRGRRGFVEKLNDVYDEEEVRAFVDRFDQLNLKRIGAGLTAAVKELNDLPVEKRRAGNISGPALYAIFEAFTCPPMYRNEELMDNQFNRPFKLLQTHKFLKLSSFTPAMTQFLFGRSTDRLWWARRSWQKFGRVILPIEFEWSVREPLLEAMARVQIHALEKGFLQQFWDGVRSIVQTLDKKLITHSLRAIDGGGIEADVSRLALSHLQVDSDGFKSLLATVLHILKTSPSDFWEAMGTFSPVVWIDEFFKSRALERLLLEASTAKISESPELDALFEWVIPFLSSIKPVNQAPACRSLLNRLLVSYQAEVRAGHTTLPLVVKTHCLRLGLHILAETFRGLNRERSISSNAVAAAEAFEIAEQHVKLVASFANKKSIVVAPASEVFRQVIGLDCKYITACYTLLSSNKAVEQNSILYHSTIWKNAINSVQPGNIVLAKRLLKATESLIGLEKLVAKSQQPELVRFNTTFEGICQCLFEMVERFNNFRPDEMESFFEDAESANSFIVLLFAPGEEVRDAAVELVKTMSGQSTRRDAFCHLLKNYLRVVMDGLSSSFWQITLRKAFVPASNMLKLCTDIVDVLFDSQDGLLRTETLSTPDAKAMEVFWQALWQTLEMVFNNTETWSTNGRDKLLLMEFCRSAMDFADKVFDQFGVLTGALEQAAGNESGSNGSPGQRLIKQPTIATGAIVKWLRLKDDFLAAKSCALVCKLLVRLKEFDTELDEDTLDYIMQIAYSEEKGKKSVLNIQQKAELLRALERHVGHPVGVPDQSTTAKPTTGRIPKNEVINFAKWEASAKSSGSERDDLSSAISAATPTFERLKAQQALKKALPKPPPKQSLIVSGPGNGDFMKRRQQEMEEAKQKRLQAIAIQRKRLTGEGSGLKGLGVLGKDHTARPKGSGMMVSSDEEGDDEDESDIELDRKSYGISSTAAKKPVGLNLTEEQEKALKSQQRQGPVKIQRLVRSAQDMRARLAPNLDELHKTLLGWEYFHQDAFPPNTSERNYTAVINSFRDPIAYQQTFGKLLVLEAWNGFLKAKEENTAKPYAIMVVSRSSVDAFLEISSTMSRVDAKEVSEGDIILLSKAASPGAAQDQPHCLSRIFRMSHKNGIVEISYRVMPGSALVRSLVPKSNIHGLKITSIVPLEREYGALHGLAHYDLCHNIIRASPSPLLTYRDAILEPLMKTYTVNKAQAKAIKCAVDNDGFTLVQGPPGSGKTKTIVAIVGALLSDTLNGTGGEARSGEFAKKMLICAPSNAAVDELVMRFKEGVKTLSGQHHKVNIVRLGRSDAINANVLDVTLDELVNEKLNQKLPASIKGETQKIMQEHKEVSENLRETRTKLEDAEANGGPFQSLKNEFDRLRRMKTTLSQKIDTAKDKERTQSQQTEQMRKTVQRQVINNAHVICATLSGSGHDMFQNLAVEFETVIIDEAAQCVELSALIPLKYGCAKCILVGDPQQLPPTVFSKHAANFKYEQSLFVRMQANHANDVHLLDTQYRMHPEISLFPSKTFYNGRLLDGNDMGPLRSRPWHGTNLLSPFRFFDVEGQHRSAPTGHSLINQAEIEVALKLYRRLTTDFEDYDFKRKIGIITPYKSQLKELKREFTQRLGLEIAESIEFNTTDAFQGREAEIIIFSCVRASPARGIGFLQDIRRMNVGLTRAKCSLWVLGNSQSLKHGEFWAKLVEDAKARDLYTTGNLHAMFERPLQLVREVEDGSLEEIPKQKKPGTKRIGSDASGHDNSVKMERTNSASSSRSAASSRSTTSSRSATTSNDNEPRKVASPWPKPSPMDHFKKGPPTSKPSYDYMMGAADTAPAVPTLKRKLSNDTTVDRKSSISSASSVAASSVSNPSEVEMKDAVSSGTDSDRDAKRRKTGSSSVTPPKLDTTTKLEATSDDAPKPAPVSTVKKSLTALPAALRKKKPVDCFMKKKPRV